LFAESTISPSSGQRRTLAISVAAHAFLLALLLHPPEPQHLTPVSVALGQNGKAVTRLYWKTQNPDDSDTSSSSQAVESYRREHLGHQKITWNRAEVLSKLALARQQAAVEDQAKNATLSKLGHGAAAGSPYGTLGYGPFFGDEIRPALPVTTADPIAYPWELPDSEGNVVVEIVIDERGEIVSKTVLQSMGPKLDEKVLEALANWRFQPARRNGMAIPSKQDAVFHFRARG